MRKVLVTAVALVAALSLAGVAAASGSTKKPPVKLSGSVNNEGTAKAVDGATDISIGDFFFDATFTKAPKGETVSATVTNDGGSQDGYGY